MEIIYSKNDLKNLIQKYYLEKEEREVEVIITSKKELMGLYETNTCVTTINVKSSVIILGSNVVTIETLSKEDIYGILNELLDTEGYVLESAEFDEGIRSECVGYFMNEHTEYVPYFNGIKLVVSKNTLSKRK